MKNVINTNYFIKYFTNCGYGEWLLVCKMWVDIKVLW